VTFNDTVCLKTQVEGCSNQKVKVYGSGLEVNITDCPDSSYATIQDAVTASLTAMLGASPFSIPNTYFLLLRIDGACQPMYNWKLLSTPKPSKSFVVVKGMREVSVILLIVFPTITN